MIEDLKVLEVGRNLVCVEEVLSNSSCEHRVV
jgi:hypothetical protein